MMNSGNIVAKDVVKMEVLNRNAVASGHLHHRDQFERRYSVEYRLFCRNPYINQAHTTTASDSHHQLSSALKYRKTAVSVVKVWWK